ncbi:MAG: hypothetical protein LAP40_22190 [Acidobacteriia bacterium]|nr:hypothetical protein [Terriglobia bacterium]
MFRVAAGFTAILLMPSLGSADLLPRLGLGTRSGSTITLRKRLHVNTLITEPGTAEIEWGSLDSFSSGNFTLPAAFKYTPQGHRIIWGRTEYSLAFDSVSVADLGGGRITQFSQSLTATATSVLHDGEKLDIAIAPQAVFFLRGEQGARLGAIAIARYDTGRHSMGVTVSWSAATHISASNPAGTLDVGLGYGRRLAAGGLLGKFTPHCNAVWERSTGLDRVVSVFEGVEYQMTERLAFDLSGQHFGINGNTPDHQIAFGITLNVGRLN